MSAKSVLEVLQDNADFARSLVNAAATGVGELAAECPSGCHRALEHAIATAPNARDPGVVNRLSVVAGRVLANEGWATDWIGSRPKQTARSSSSRSHASRHILHPNAAAHSQIRSCVTSTNYGIPGRETLCPVTQSDKPVNYHSQIVKRKQEVH